MTTESPGFYFIPFLEVKTRVNIVPFGLLDQEYSLIK